MQRHVRRRGLLQLLFMFNKQVGPFRYEKSDHSKFRRQVLEWFERQRPKMEYQRDLLHHPGIETIQSIVAYFRRHKIQTRIIGTNYRRVG
jgi:hypothetical protein